MFIGVSNSSYMGSSLCHNMWMDEFIPLQQPVLAGLANRCWPLVKRKTLNRSRWSERAFEVAGCIRKRTMSIHSKSLCHINLGSHVWHNREREGVLYPHINPCLPSYLHAYMHLSCDPCVKACDTSTSDPSIHDSKAYPDSFGEEVGPCGPRKKGLSGRFRWMMWKMGWPRIPSAISHFLLEVLQDKAIDVKNARLPGPGFGCCSIYPSIDLYICICTHVCVCWIQDPSSYRPTICCELAQVLACIPVILACSYPGIGVIQINFLREQDPVQIKIHLHCLDFASCQFATSKRPSTTLNFCFTSRGSVFIWQGSFSEHFLKDMVDLIWKPASL
jgi:hypothetical protein